MAYQPVQPFTEREILRFRNKCWVNDVQPDINFPQIHVDTGRMKKSYRNLMDIVKMRKHAILDRKKLKWDNNHNVIRLPGLQPGNVFYGSLTWDEVKKIRLTQHGMMYKSNITFFLSFFFLFLIIFMFHKSIW